MGFIEPSIMTREEEISKASIDYAERQTAGILGIEKQIAISSYEAGAEWADSHPINPWHSVADGDLPKKSGDYLCSDGGEFIVAYYHDVSRFFENPLTRYGGDYNDCIKYWMEIPILQINTSSALSKMER